MNTIGKYEFIDVPPIFVPKITSNSLSHLTLLLGIEQRLGINYIPPEVRPMGSVC